jgi:hypothetical protein
MATIDSRGLVNDGSPNLTVAGTLIANQYVMAPIVVAGVTGALGYVVLGGPGFYAVPCSGTSGQGAFTGSLPAANVWPGGEILVTDTNGWFGYMLTGSVAMMTGSNGSTVASLNGTKLKVSAGGTVGLWSDSKGWLVSAVSGTVTLS